MPVLLDAGERCPNPLGFLSPSDQARRPPPPSFPVPVPVPVPAVNRPPLRGHTPAPPHPRPATRALQARTLAFALAITLLLQPAPTPAATRPTPTPGPQPLRSAAAIRALHPTPNSTSPAPVAEIEGVILLHEPRWWNGYIHDGSASVAFTGKALPKDLRPGQRVRLRGTVQPSRFAPILDVTEVSPRGRAELPPPRPPDPENLAVGAEDGQWIEVRGVVRHASAESGYTVWNIAGELRNFEAIFLATPSQASISNWVGATVSLRGICLSEVNALGQFSHFRIAANSVADARRLHPAPADPFASPLLPISQILRFSPIAESGRSTRIRGTVTWSRPGSPFQIQDHTAAIAVSLGSGNPPPIGTTVEVVGFPSPGPHTPTLEFARYRESPPTPPPSPRLIDLSHLSPAEDGLLVTVEGAFLDHVQHGPFPELALRDDLGRHVQILLAQPVSNPSLVDLERGSRLRLTGVFRMHADAANPPAGHRILVDSDSRIIALAPGPWWNTRRATTAATALLLASTAGIAWTATLRRRLAAQRRTLEHELAQRLALEQRHRDLTEGAPDAIFTLDSTGTILSANPAAARFAGCSEEELRQLSIFDILPPEERPRAADSIANRFRIGGASPPFLVEIIDRRGQRRSLEVVSQLLVRPGSPPRLEGVARDVTDRLRAENALRSLAALTAEGGGERFFRALTRQVADLLGTRHALIAILDPDAPGHLRTLAIFSDGAFTANPSFPLAATACETVVGHAENVIHDNLRSLFPDDPLNARLGADAFAGFPLWGDAHRPLGVLALLGSAPLDPTPPQLDMLRVLAARVGSEVERIRASEALRLSEERFRELADHGDDILWVYDVAQQRLAYLAPSFTRLTGIETQAWLNTPRQALRLIDPRDRPRWLRAFAAALRDPDARHSFEYRIRPPGSPLPRWILDQAVVIRDPSGTPIRISGVARDITARKEAELALAAERARFRDLFENSPVAVFVKSCDGIVLDVNQAGCRLHRIPKEHLLGRHLTELVPEPLREETRRQFRQLVSGELSTTESTALRSDGSCIPVELHVSRIPHEGRNALLIHIHDISARREAGDFLAGQMRILEWIATSRPLDEVLAELARVTEARAPGTLCWTHHCDGNATPATVAPSLDTEEAKALASLLLPGGPVASRLAASTGQHVLLEDALHPAASPPPSPSNAPGRRDLLALPIQSATGTCLGTFGAFLPPGHSPKPDDLDHHRLAASLARIAIERHRTDASLRKGSERLRTANAALLALARSEAISRGDLAAALAEICEAAARTVQASRVAVWLLDEDAGVLRRVHVLPQPPTPQPHAPEIQVEDIPLYIGAISHARLVSVPDALTDPRVAELIRQPGLDEPHPARLDAGIRLRGRIAGVVTLEAEGPTRRWGSDEELIAGSLADIVAMALQASERRCIEEALRQSEEAYRSVVSALAEGVILVNREGSFLAFNQSAGDILGIPSRELSRRRLDDPGWIAILPDGSPIPSDQFPAAITLRTGQPLVDSIMGLQRPDGSTAWISVNTRPFARGDDGQVVSVVSSFTDITRRQEAERALREGHELVRAISEVQASFIADANPDRSVERMLATLVRMTRATTGVVAEVVEAADTTQHLRRFPTPATTHPTHPIPDSLLEEVRASGAPYILTRPGTPTPTPVEPEPQPQHLLVLPLRDDTEVVGVVAVSRNSAPFTPDLPVHLAPLLITCASLVRAIRTDRQREEAEARIRQLNAELEQRVDQRTADLNAINQELAEFAYVVTHDLKAPLRGIHQLSEWLAQDHASQLDTAGHHLLALMRQRVLHLQRLIDGLLACARVGRSPEPVSRVATLDLVRQVISVIAPPLHIDFTVDEHLPAVEGNPERLHQLFQNLLDNAVKYLDKPKGRIQVSAQRDHGAWIFTISDNGPGIPKRYREKVFQIFQRLHETGDIPGTGLGLTLVKRIVESRGGRIWIESEPGAGTAVRFTWPDHARERTRP